MGSWPSRSSAEPLDHLARQARHASIGKIIAKGQRLGDLHVAQFLRPEIRQRALGRPRAEAGDSVTLTLADEVALTYEVEE